MANIIHINFNRNPDQYLEQIIQEQLQDEVFPGIEILVAVESEVRIHRAWGKLEVGPSAPSLTVDTLFDIASITKPMATAMAVMVLQERGLLDINESIAEFLPEFENGDKRHITLKQLLTHTSGLPAWENLYEGSSNKDDAWQRLLQVPLQYESGQQMIYSCLDFLILGEIIRKITQQPLTDFVHEKVFNPMKLSSTSFKPLEFLDSDIPIAPTQYCPYRKALLRGIVHDENSYIFNQEGGNAGVFSTAQDLFRFAQMIIDGGATEDQAVLSAHSIFQMTQNHNKEDIEPRGLGWDIKGFEAGYSSCGSLFPSGSIGHTGFTGTSLWIDLATETIVILLSNRVHISREKNQKAIQRFRPRIHNILLSLADYF